MVTKARGKGLVRTALIICVKNSNGYRREREVRCRSYTRNDRNRYNGSDICVWLVANKANWYTSLWRIYIGQEPWEANAKHTCLLEEDRTISNMQTTFSRKHPLLFNQVGHLFQN